MIEPSTVSVIVLAGIALAAEARCAVRRAKIFSVEHNHKAGKKHRRQP